MTNKPAHERIRETTKTIAQLGLAANPRSDGNLSEYNRVNATLDALADEVEGTKAEHDWDLNRYSVTLGVVRDKNAKFEERDVKHQDTIIKLQARVAELEEVGRFLLGFVPYSLAHTWPRDIEGKVTQARAALEGE